MTRPALTRPALSVWAPRPDTVELVVEAGGTRTRLPMERDPSGWWQPVEDVVALVGGREVDYGFSLDGADPLPDPRSRRQPYGPHGLSRTYDPSTYAWTDTGWTGRQLAGAVVYELHVGTFTPEGTFAAAATRLDHLADLGVTHVEVMPVNDFNGPHGWGYDGVLWHAVHEAYGGPAGYSGFVDACHARGLAVIQDVVHNHLGPSGNYLPQFGPYLHTAAANTWGQAVNLDGEGSDEVRRFVLDSTRVFLHDYHVDGLRLDAVHALVDTRATHLLEELAAETAALSAAVGRPLSLVAESDLNDPRLITPREAGGYGLDGQWSDDFHHALYVALTGDASGYYADFSAPGALARVLTDGFFHTGTPSSFRGRRHGRPLDPRTPAWRLVVCSDNHDQIGNRADGHRLSSVLDPRQQSLAAVVTLLSPFTPMVFMGEEWGARTPWQFFTSHPEPELGEAVARGRREEFAAMEWGDTEVPDPQDPETFRRSVLDWGELDQPGCADLLALYRRLLRLRRELPDVTDPRLDRTAVRHGGEQRWLLVERGDLVVAVNFSAEPVEVGVDGSVATLVAVGEAAAEGGVVRLGAHSALVGTRA